MNEHSQTGDLPVVAISGLAVRSLRDERTILLEGVNWEIRSGDYWAVAGLQGSGKTDLLLTMAGLIPPGGGTCRLYGEEMPIYDEARMPTRLRLGLVFEGGQLFNHLSIAGNISLPLRYHRNLSTIEAEEETTRLLEVFDLGRFADSTPGALGRNWQRRVGLARALALKPDILLVDGPLTGLDLPHTNWWLGMLERLSKGHEFFGNKPITLVVTGADLRPWRNRARQFAAVRDGRLVVLGSWQQVETERTELVREIFDDRFPGGERV
jgi:ABC-type transporter Mla maintaining outer membrane lipid asymmetry ATPase subunit MlaF